MILHNQPLWNRYGRENCQFFLEKIRKCKCGFGHSFSYHINIFSFVCISASIGHFTDLVWHQVNVRELDLSLKYIFSQLKNSVIHGWCISSKLSSTASIVTVCRMSAAYVRMCEYIRHINVWLPGLWMLPFHLFVRITHCIHPTSQENLDLTHLLYKGKIMHGCISPRCKKLLHFRWDHLCI